MFRRRNQREEFRRYLEGLLLPDARYKALAKIANREPLTRRQWQQQPKLQRFLSTWNWDERRVREERLQLLRADSATTPHAHGILAINETGDRKYDTQTAHVGRQYLTHLDHIGNGVVSVNSLWADTQRYYPLDVEPYTPPSYFTKGERDPAFRTKLDIALELVKQAIAEAIPFRAVVADSYFGEDLGFKHRLRQLKVPYVMELSPSHGWYHLQRVNGTLQDELSKSGWIHANQPGKWIGITRTFRNGNSQDWWAIEIVAGPYGPEKKERAIVATTDPKTLPASSTWYLVTNLPALTHPVEEEWQDAPASINEIIQLYGQYMWVKQSYTQVQNALGWSHYQVRSDQAIRRHWQLVCCAFSFCWHHASHAPSSIYDTDLRQSEPEAFPSITPSAEMVRMGKNQPELRETFARHLVGDVVSNMQFVRTIDYAAAVIARLVSTAPSFCYEKPALEAVMSKKGSDPSTKKNNEA